MLVGAYDVMGREGGDEVRCIVRMASAYHLVEAGGLVPTNAIGTAVANAIVNRRDTIACLDRLARPINLNAVAQCQYPPTHLVARHGAVSSAELPPPHMHLRAAYVGLCNLGENAAGWRCRDVVFMEINLVGGGDERDSTLHNDSPRSGHRAPI